MSQVSTAGVRQGRFSVELPQLPRGPLGKIAPVFPDLCGRCGAKGAPCVSRIDEYPPSFFRYAKLFKSVHIEVPVCETCSNELKRAESRIAITMGLCFFGGLLLIIALTHAGITDPATISALAIGVALLPVLIWALKLKPPVILVSRVPNGLRFEFSDKDYAVQFAALNKAQPPTPLQPDDAVWEKVREKTD